MNRNNETRQRAPSLNAIVRILTVVLGSALCSAPLQAQLQVLPDEKTPVLFAGPSRPVRITVHNPKTETVTANVSAMISQTTSATAARLGRVPWKQLQLLPGQTILETATLDFPTVNAETRFLVEWIDGTNRVFGKTEVVVYPTNLLTELKALAGETLPGVLDPGRRLKPLLKTAGVEFTDLEETAIENFPGRFAVVGPFSSKTQMPENLAGRIRTVSRKNVAVVWIQPPEKTDKPRPSFYSVAENQTATVVVQPDLVADLAENPQSQLNLIYFCKLALHPEPLTLPHLPPKL
jgi:hypothetical protein